jgi:hypothetical protein
LRRIKEWLVINGKNVEEIDGVIIWDIIPIFAWVSAWTTSVTMPRLRTEILSRDLLNLE